MKLRYKLSVIFLSLFMLTSFSSKSLAAGEKIVGFDENVESYLIGDELSGKIYYEKNSDEVKPMASLSKLMTYLLVKESIDRGDLDLDQKIKADKETEKLTSWEYSSLGLRDGEEYSIRELLEGLIVVSGNDCAYLLAKAVSGSEAKFAMLMNDKAKTMGLDSQVYYNASGIETENEKQNSSSAKDLFILSKYILDTYPEIIDLSKKDEVVIADKGISKKSTIPLKDSIKSIDGLKTGTTNEAGYCLVSTGSLIDIDPLDDFRVIGVVMGADQADTRDSAMTDLFYYVSRTYSKREVLDTNNPIESIESVSAKEGYIDLYPKENLAIISRDDENIYTNINLDSKIKAPIKEGEVVGNIDVNYKDEAYNIDLVSSKNISEASLFSRITRTIEENVNFLLKVLIAR